MKTYTDKQLLYSATARCKCGAGLAYPLNHGDALELAAWVCSRVLRGEVPHEGHESYSFCIWKIREETSINNTGKYSTRPPGTKCLTQGEAQCPKCGTFWESEPYNACGTSHHWFSGPCPSCGYTVGSAGSHSSKDGPAIKHTYKDVVVDA